ncbi:ATP-binding protein [Priestia koreensis]|uniref:ATP-binding protein n=1 Tax=Priestia koreensis TaxID=284581 RepID=UPI001F58C3D6|nr:ATP-binding protein [Priestia koreensis]UNL85871.1 histidine kinase [Priestia koreensis]
MTTYSSEFKLKNICLFLVMVLIPSIVLSLLFVQFRYYQFQQDHRRVAESTARLHKNNLDRFIGDTRTSIETIAMTIRPITQDSKDLERRDDITNTLHQLHRKDERLSGLYYVDMQGDMFLGSHPLSKIINVYDRDFFQDVIKQKQTAISDAYYGRLTGRYIVTMATPVQNEKQQIGGILLATLRLDYLKKLTKQASPSDKVQLYGKNQILIFDTNHDVEYDDSSFTYTMKLDQAPWTLVVTVPAVSDAQITHWFIYSMFLSLIITTVLFLLLNLWRTKRQNERERAANEAQKLELIGTLAAGTAHEIRNPLTGIKGLVTLLSETHTNEKDQYYFSVIQTEIDRINQIVSEFLILGKPTAQNLQTCDIREIITESLPIIESEANMQGIQVKVDLPPTALLISCEQNQIKQVLLNLAKNALDSMQENGQLTISSIKDGKYCVLSITDNGTGISKEVLPKLFTPFFTMKETGTGLGLIVCKRIIEMHAGTIAISSELNVGTTVSVTLPLVK